jgi:hypothetical protein
MRRAVLTLVVLFFLVMILGLQLFWLAPNAQKASVVDQKARRKLAHQLSLTDLALWTEARYTRHPSQADLFAAFQDGPAAFEHFAAGSILAPLDPQIKTRLLFKKRADFQ